MDLLAAWQGQKRFYNSLETPQELSLLLAQELVQGIFFVDPPSFLRSLFVVCPFFCLSEPIVLKYFAYG